MRNCCFESPKTKSRESTSPSIQRPFNGAEMLRITERKNKYKYIATWNVKTYNSKWIEIEILGINEGRWSGSEIVKSAGYITYYYGKKDNLHESGVVIITCW